MRVKVEELAKALQSALRFIACEHENEFVDEEGKETGSWKDGNLTCGTVSNDFGEFEFDFRECLNALKRAGLKIEGPKDRPQYDFRGFLQQFASREGADRAMKKLREAMEEGAK